MTEFHSLFFTDQPGTSAPADPFVGRTIDKYFIEQRIGRGGMGAVYRAHHTMFDKCVAIKLLSSNLVDDPKTFERFRREATAAARLKHVNVVGVTDFAKTDEGIPYLVMEYVDGYSLRYILDHKPVLSPEQVVALMKQIGAAVHAAHRKGIVHRDLKPDNIMIEISEGEEIIKVLDFGIAKLRDLTTGKSYQSEAESLIGTPQYMSPEQCDGTNLDMRSDIYSLGVMAYEMLTGQVPFTGKPATIMVQHLSKAPLHICSIATDLAAAIGDCIMRALAKDPGDRFESALDFALALEKALPQPVDTRLYVLREIIGQPSPEVPVGETSRGVTQTESEYLPFTENLQDVLEEFPMTDLPTDQTKVTLSEAPLMLSPVREALSSAEVVQPAGAEDQENSHHLSEKRRELYVVTAPTEGLAGRRFMFQPRVVGWVSAVSLLCLLVVAAIGTLIHQYLTYHSLRQKLISAVSARHPNLKELHQQIEQIAVHQGIALPSQAVKIIVDPPNHQLTVVLKYTSSYCAIPLHYEIEQTVQDYPLTLEELAQVPVGDLQLVNISAIELENYRFEKGISTHPQQKPEDDQK